MRDILAGLLPGLLFGFGLCLSGLADPSNIQGFLDVAGSWNPILLFVMASGLTVTLIGYRLVFDRGRPVFSPRFNIPASGKIDASLLSGAVLFGIGWGLAGYCPGPAVVSLANRRPEVLVFLVAMLMGMSAVRWMLARPNCDAQIFDVDKTLARVTTRAPQQQ